MTIDIGKGVEAPAWLLRKLVAAWAVIAEDEDSPMTPARLALGIDAFLAACGMDTGQVIEADTPSSRFAQLTGSAVDYAGSPDFLIHTETFPARTAVNPEPGTQVHICSAPVSLRRYVEGECPRCGRDL